MKIFVSYKRDHAESEALLSLLETELPKAYGKVNSDRLLTAGEWRPKLLEWIDGCDLFVILLSEKGVESDEVKEEVHRAYDRWVATGRKKPTIIPVRVNYTGPLDGFRRDLNGFQGLRWTGEADNKTLLTKIRSEVAKGWRPRVFAAIAALLVVALLVYYFVVAPLGNIRKLRAATPATEPAAGKVIALSEAKKYRDAASRPGWSSRAGAAYARYLGRWSAGHLANARKSINQGKVPEGLVLAALVAQENDGKIDPSFLKDYEEGHYRLLRQTLRTGSTLGAGLAVSSDGTQIAAGNALWSPPSQTRCSLGSDAINVVAFGPRGLYTGGNEHILAWTVCRPGAQFPVTRQDEEEDEDVEDRVQYLAIAPDDSFAFVMRKGRSVLLQESGTTSRTLKHPEPVRSIAFSRDGSVLVTTSGETLNVWNRRETRPVPTRIETGLPLRGASLKGEYVTVAGPRSVKVWRWRPTLQFQYEIAFDVPIRAVALSDEPGLVAVVTDEGVLLEQVSKDAFRLGGSQSVASEVVFSDVGRQLVIKRVDAIEIWNPDTSPTPMDAPRQTNLFEDWSRRFALTVDENSRFEPILFKEAR
jgi:hypothetical protein